MVLIDFTSILESKGTRSIEELPLQPGFRFHPTDEELMWYLITQAGSELFKYRVIEAVDLYNVDPWDLPELALFGEKEWYFFTPRNRKYPRGKRPNRRAKNGYWKVTGTEKPIYMPNSNGGQTKVGVKNSLVFYRGNAPKGDKTNWNMHEFLLTDGITQPSPLLQSRDSTRLDEWVLCRIKKKKPSRAQQAAGQEQNIESMLTSAVPHFDEQPGSDSTPPEVDLDSVAVTSETTAFPFTMSNIPGATTSVVSNFQDTMASSNVWNPQHAMASTSQEARFIPEQSGPGLHYMQHPELRCYQPLSSSSFTDPSHYSTCIMSAASQRPSFSDEVESQVQYYGTNSNALPFLSFDHSLANQSTYPGGMDNFSYGHAPGPNHFS